MKRTGCLCLTLLAAACSDIELDPPKEVVHARFDPEAKEIPMPTDILRDDELGTLDLPVDDEDITVAEREFYAFLNTMDGWSSAMAATVEFSAPIDPATINEDTLQVWRWGGVPERVTDARISIDEDEQKLTIDAPRFGWERGETYVVVMRGGAAGVEGKRGEPVECDAAFYFLRQTEKLDTPNHERAFPGDDKAERVDNAEQLEEIRADLSPYFDYFANLGMEREEVAALWEFTITERAELAMDKPSQRMPLPNNLILDPNTGLVDLPAAEWDSDVEVEAKHKLRVYDGFATSGELLFEFTAPMDAATINGDSVKLYKLGDAPEEIPVEAVLMDDLEHVRVIPQALPLEEQTTYAVVVDTSVRDINGGEVMPMPVGHFLKSESQVFVDGESQVGPVEAEDAHRVENVRTTLQPLLEQIGRNDVLAAWPFTTMTIKQPLDEWVIKSELLGVSPDPSNIEHVSTGDAIADFPLGFNTMLSVREVIEGTIKSPVYLDSRTRGWREDGGYEVQDIAFMMTIPANADPGRPLPVVIFGHGVMTERRFVLTVADALAQRGYAAIAIDLPMHGTRTHCLHGGPLSLIDPSTGELTSLEPCEAGYTCAEDGRCVDESNQGNHLAVFPIVNMYAASGAAFIEVEHIANTRDHFVQSLIDLGSLSRSLRKGDWQTAIGYQLETDEMFYAGMSLGGIIGATFVSLSPEITRAVLNVPGSNTVELFTDSTFFGPHVEAFFTREGVEVGSFQAERFMTVAHWFMDSADPQNVAQHLLDNGRKVLIQMATLDFIIPNAYTLQLEDISGAPRIDYVGEHAFLAIPLEPAYGPGSADLAAFIDGELEP